MTEREGLRALVDDLPEEEVRALEEAEEDAREGRLISHDEIRRSVLGEE